VQKLRFKRAQGFTHVFVYSRPEDTSKRGGTWFCLEEDVIVRRARVYAPADHARLEAALTTSCCRSADELDNKCPPPHPEECSVAYTPFTGSSPN
jgi:hypothetical protein